MPILGKGSGRGEGSSEPEPGQSAREFWSSAPAPGKSESFWSRGSGSRSLGSGIERVSTGTAIGARRPGLLATCANPQCDSGWLHLLRSRSAPIFEGGWSCSLACTAARVEAALRRELEGKRPAPPLSAGPHRHRIPLGLVMLEQGWITSEQLRQALEAQRAAGGQGRLGRWLVHRHGIEEALVARALSLQWSCPVLSVDRHDAEAMAVVLPRLFIDAFGALPLRLAAGSILYMGFEDRLDPVLTLAVERMYGWRVESGLVPDSDFEAAQQRMLDAAYPRAELVEAASQTPLVRVLTRAIERVRPVEARLVRVHDCLWLRLWTRPQSGDLPDGMGVEDVIGSLALD